MFQGYKNKISIKTLKIGDKVIGMHADPAGSYTTVAGKISKITSNKSGDVTYHVVGDLFIRPSADSISLSGFLEESEVEVIDPGTYRIIIELFDLANKQLISGSPFHTETVQKIRDLRYKSRQKHLREEKKCA